MGDKIILDDDGETVRFEELIVKDRDVYQFFEDLDEEQRQEFAERSVAMGVTGFKRLSTSAEVDYVEKEFDRVVEEIDEMFNPEKRNSYFGQLEENLDDYSEELEENLEDYFEQLEENLEDYFEDGGTVEEIFDPSDKSTPIGKFKVEMMDELTKVQEKIASEKREEEVKEKTPLKGEEFEDFCERVLGEKVCSNMGDELFRTSDDIGELTGCKKGDFVAKPSELDGKNIVLEMKSGKISQRKILEDELPEAMENRSADYAILISKRVENLPNKIGWFNEFRGNMLVCAIGNQDGEYFPSLLNVAYQYGKQRLKEEKTEEAEVDVETIETGIENVEQKISKISNLKRKATNIDNATDEIRDLSDEIRDEIKEELDEMTDAIS